MLRVRRIPAKQNAARANFQYIAVEAAMHIAAHASSPVRHLERPDVCRTDVHFFTPAQFMNVSVVPRAQQIRRAQGSHHAGSGTFETSQAGQIEMVHVRVRQQDEIDGRQILQVGCHVYHSFDTQRERPEIQPDPQTENRVRQNGEAVDIQEDGAMSQPGSM